LFSSHLSAGLDPLHETEEDDDPSQKQSQRQVVLEAAKIACAGTRRNVLNLDHKVEL
jgi:hypothetical protein